MNHTLLVEWHQARHFPDPDLDRFDNAVTRHDDHELAAVLDAWDQLRPPTVAEINTAIRERRDREAALAGRTAATAAMRRTRAEHENRKAERALNNRLANRPTVAPPARQAS